MLVNIKRHHSTKNAIQPLKIVSLLRRSVFFFRLHTSTTQNIKETHFQFMPCIYFCFALYIVGGFIFNHKKGSIYICRYLLYMRFSWYTCSHRSDGGMKIIIPHNTNYYYWIILFVAWYHLFYAEPNPFFTGFQ